MTKKIAGQDQEYSRNSHFFDARLPLKNLCC